MGTPTARASSSTLCSPWASASRSSGRTGLARAPPRCPGRFAIWRVRACNSPPRYWSPATSLSGPWSCGCGSRTSLSGTLLVGSRGRLGRRTRPPPEVRPSLHVTAFPPGCGCRRSRLPAHLHQRASVQAGGRGGPEGGSVFLERASVPRLTPAHGRDSARPGCLLPVLIGIALSRPAPTRSPGSDSPSRR